MEKYNEDFDYLECLYEEFYNVLMKSPTFKSTNKELQEKIVAAAIQAVY